MNFEEIRDRKLKIITTQYFTLPNGPATSAQQSSAFNANTKAIIIRSSVQTGAMYVHFKIGVNPTATGADFPMFPNNDIFTFNVDPGQKISIIATVGSNVTVQFFIIELG